MKRTRRLASSRSQRKHSQTPWMRRNYRTARVEQLETRIVFSHNGSTAHNFAMPADLEAIAEANAAASGVLSPSPFPAFTWTTLANGMPVLNSFPSAPSAIYLDFDGDSLTDTDPYDRDGNPTSFSTSEQAEIAEAWRQVSIYFAMFNVTVTTTPLDKPTAWIAIGNNIDNAYSGVNVFPGNDRAESWSQSSYARTRISALTHELGHNFGSWHIAGYDNLGNKTAEYHGAFDPLHGPLMGLDYTGVIHKWSAWHDSTDVATLQDDMARIAADLDNFGGDGYRPDDFNGTIATATPLTVVDSTTQSRVGIIERLTDADAFSFSSDGGRYAIMVGRDAPSGVDVKISVYDSAGILLATDDGDPRKQPYTMVNDSHLTLDLPAGTFYVIVQSHGNYGDQGQYVARVDKLSDNWTSAAVGLVGIPGYVNYNASNNRYIVAGSGDDIWNSSDSFHYLYQKLTGDGSITVRVESQDNTDTHAKAGIMIRESLDGGSKNAMLEVKPGNTTHFQYRTAKDGGSNSVTGPSGSTWRWLRLTRTGNSIKAEVSTNGSSWTTVGTQTVTMGATVYVGMATTSHNNLRLNSAVFSNVSLTGNLNAAPALNNFVAPSGLSATAVTNNSVSLSWNPVAVPNDLNGDGTVNSLDLNIVKTNFGRIGASGSPGDANGDGVVDIRDYNLIKNSVGVAPTGYAIERSADGVTFTQIGTTALGVTSFASTGLSESLRYFYRVRTLSGSGVSTPSTAISATTRAGAVSDLNIISYTSNTLILDWSDASGETKYRLERSLDGTTGWATVVEVGKNVPMYVNGGLTAGTKYFYRVVTVDGLGDAAISSVASAFTRSVVTNLQFTNKASNQMAIQWSAAAGATSYQVERSNDRSTWTTVSASQTGLTFTDNNVVSLEKYYYRVTPLNSTAPGEDAIIFAATPASAAQQLPSGWTSSDIGIDTTTANARSGAAGINGSSVTVLGAGTDIWGSSDQFRFTYVTMSGNGSITARVVSVADTNYYSRGGVMFRDSANSVSRYASLMVHQSDFGVRMQYRTATSGSNRNSTEKPAVGDGATQAAPYWVRLTRTGDTFLAEASADGTSWFTIGSQVVDLANTVRVGLAITPRDYDNNLMNKVVFDNVTIVSSSGTITLGSSGAASAPTGQASTSGGGRAAVAASQSPTKTTAVPKTKSALAGVFSELSRGSKDKKTVARISSLLRSIAADDEESSRKSRRLTNADRALISWLEDHAGSRAGKSLAQAIKTGKIDDSFFLGLGQKSKLA